MFRTLKLLTPVFTTLLIGACTTTSAPEQTYDGLVRVPEARLGDVYRLPGAELDGYQAFGLEPCEVAFRKNWLRDQNSSRVDLTQRVTQEDVDRIRGFLAEQCYETFREALLESPAYNLVDEFNTGQEVLVIRPQIIDLDVNAPDTMSAGRSRSYTTSEGEMTLSLELVDSTTGQVLARVVDKARGTDSGRIQWTSGVSNRAEAERVLRRWASQFRTGLDSVIRK